jgi:hypothetical protein
MLEFSDIVKLSMLDLMDKGRRKTNQPEKSSVRIQQTTAFDNHRVSK